MKAYAAQVAQERELELKKIPPVTNGQPYIESPDRISQQQANQTASYSSMLDSILAFLRDLARKMAQLFTRAFTAAPGLSVQKHDSEPARWLTQKGVWSEQELSQGILPDNKINSEIKASLKQEAVQQEAPKQEAQQQVAAIKNEVAQQQEQQAQEQAQAQEQDAPSQASHRRRRR